MKHILIVDDEPEMLNSLRKILSRRPDLQLELINKPQTALDLVSKKKFDLIITDLKMNPVSGMDILKTALGQFSDSTVIILSGYGTIEAGVEAMREGAFDFIEKPFTSKKLFDCIDRALNQNYKQTETFEADKLKDPNFSGLIYTSSLMSDLIKMVGKIAPGNMSVLITGESGTGKELISRAIHQLSKRNLNPFVPVNCGALPEHLFESELFGHERGAFTGAVKTKPGLLEFANHGTFFFDEIGELSMAMQVKLLRMLEERKIRHVGGEKEIDIDVRIIAATNKDLEQAVAEKKFREDLFYRLNTIHLNIPPLRERTEDIVPLANHFLAQLCSNRDKVVHRFSSDAELALQSHPWSGNVRELQNMVERAYYMCSDQVIQRSDLPIPVNNPTTVVSNELLELPYKAAKDRIYEQFEIEYLTEHLKRNKGNISQTAAQCGLDRRTIHRLINKYNIIYKE